MLRMKALIPRLRRDEEEHARFPDAADDTLELQRYDDRQPPAPSGEKLDDLARAVDPAHEHR